VFGEANERLETALGLEEIRDRLRAVGWFGGLSDDELLASLKQLAQWQLLDVIQNHAENYRVLCGKALFARTDRATIDRALTYKTKCIHC
jgi:hypothetical protein